MHKEFFREEKSDEINDQINKDKTTLDKKSKIKNVEEKSKLEQQNVVDEIVPQTEKFDGLDKQKKM